MYPVIRTVEPYLGMCIPGYACWVWVRSYKPVQDLMNHSNRHEFLLTWFSRFRAARIARMSPEERDKIRRREIAREEERRWAAEDEAARAAAERESKRAARWAKKHGAEIAVATTADDPRTWTGTEPNTRPSPSPRTHMLVHTTPRITGLRPITSAFSDPCVMRARGQRLRG